MCPAISLQGTSWIAQQPTLITKCLKLASGDNSSLQSEAAIDIVGRGLVNARETTGGFRFDSAHLDSFGHIITWRASSLDHIHTDNILKHGTNTLQSATHSTQFIKPHSNNECLCACSCSYSSKWDRKGQWTHTPFGTEALGFLCFFWLWLDGLASSWL